MNLQSNFNQLLGLTSAAASVSKMLKNKTQQPLQEAKSNIQQPIQEAKSNPLSQTEVTRQVTPMPVQALKSRTETLQNQTSARKERKEILNRKRLGGRKNGK